MQLLVNFTNLILNPLIALIFAAGFFMFIWGLVQFLQSMNESADHQEGVQHMLWGIIGMFIMVSVKGILYITINTFGIPQSAMDVSRMPQQPANGWFTSQ